MKTVYLALLLFGSESEPQACHAEVHCPGTSLQCTVKIKSCEITLPQCLHSTVVTAMGRFQVLGCSNKPNPKTADVDVTP